MHYQTQYYRVQLTILLGDGLIEAAMGQCSQTRIWQNTIRLVSAYDLFWVSSEKTKNKKQNQKKNKA